MKHPNTQEEFLVDTIKYYSKNPEKRCADGDICRYSGKTLNKNTPGCAIGRFLSPTKRQQIDTQDIQGDYGSPVWVLYKNERLPRWMMKMDIKFLNEIQRLHDKNAYWTEKGLSDDGKNRVKQIIVDHDLNLNLDELGL